MSLRSFYLPLFATLWAVVLSGCSSTDRHAASDSQPASTVGTAIGTAAGTVMGNVAGEVVALGESAAAAAKVSFDGERRLIREWRTETTPDGRTIRVAYEIEIDAQGRPIGPPRPARY